MSIVGTMKSNKVLTAVYDYFMLTLGLVIFCLAWTSFLIPGGIASGGLTGLCTVMQFGTGIPLVYPYLTLNIVLLIIGFLALGKGFGLKTVYGILISTILFDVLPRFDFLVITFDDRLFTALVGGMIEAIGIGIVLMRGGSTGGTDIIAMVINKYWPVSQGRVYLILDLFIIASILLIPGKTVNDMIYGYVTMITFSFAVDWVLMGSRSSVQMLIFSDKYEKIADILVYGMDRGVTVLKAEGWYSKQDKNVLLVICRKQQYTKITEMVKSIDPRAFVSISSTNSVYGEGFEEIKTGVKPTELFRRKKNKGENR